MQNGEITFIKTKIIFSNKMMCNKNFVVVVERS